MTREELLDGLRAWQEDADPETAHFEADKMLLAYIDDAEITEAFKRVDRWYT